MLQYKKELNLPVSQEVLYRWHTKDNAFDRLNPNPEQLKCLEIKGSFEARELKLKHKLFPFNWVFKHTDTKENHYFTDIQKKGPFKHWTHTHCFEALQNNQSRLIDSIRYQLPFPFVTHPLLGSFFNKLLNKQFTFRHKRLKEDLYQISRYPNQPLKIAISGSSGLIGTQLCHFLTCAGHHVVPITRTKIKEDDLVLNTKTGEYPCLNNIDVLMHLAGESIASPIRWSQKKKDEIYNSRITSSKFLKKSIKENPPKVIICASAIGAYPQSHNNECFNEESSFDSHFLAQVVQDWEAALCETKQDSRLVFARFGLVLSPVGGLLKQLLGPFKLGLGAILGNKEAWWSWVALDDAIYALHHLIHTNTAGPVNICSPIPVTQKGFVSALSKKLKRPCLFSAPSFIIRFVMGEMGRLLVLSNQKVSSKKLEESGFKFSFPNLKSYLDFSL